MKQSGLFKIMVIKRMQINKIQYENFGECYECLHNGRKLVISSDFGPRILFFGFSGRKNIFYNDQSKTVGNEDTGWLIYGGHRLWPAPETSASYQPDNSACTIKTSEDIFEISIITGALKKTILIQPQGDRFLITHKFSPCGEALISGALWALTCVRPDCTVFFPWGTSGSWSLKKIIYWQKWIDHGSDINSSQYIRGNDLFLIKPSGEEGKVGTSGYEGFIGAVFSDCTFIKKFRFIEGALYPDEGCALECYTCSLFIELETLSPFCTMIPGHEYTHTEEWILCEKIINPADGQAARSLL